MARKVTAMDVRMAAALAQGVDDVAGLCRAQGISRKTYYKWKRRFDREGLDGLRDRPRRPNTTSNATPADVEDAIVRARKELADAGEPLRSQVQTYRTHVSAGGSVTVSGPPGSVRNQLRVHLGGRYKQLPVTVLPDGIRVAVFAGNELIRALDRDLTKIYQPLHP